MNTEWYCINNLSDFVDSSRKLVFKFFGHESEHKEHDMLAAFLELSPEETKELEKSLSYEEALGIVMQYVKKQKHKHNHKKERYCLNDKILQQIIEALNSRLVSNILNDLSNRGILESGYDEELNDFVFWIKDK